MRCRLCRVSLEEQVPQRSALQAQLAAKVSPLERRVAVPGGVVAG